MAAELAVDEEERKLFQRSLSFCMPDPGNEGRCIPSVAERLKESWKAVMGSFGSQSVEAKVGSSVGQGGETFASQIGQQQRAVNAHYSPQCCWYATSIQSH